MKHELLDDFAEFDRLEEGLQRPTSVGVMLRLVAFFFDCMTIIMLSTILGTFIAILALIIPESSLGLVKQVLFAALFILYYPLLESSRLQASVGKFVVSIKVVDEKEERLTFGQALWRFVASVIACVLVLGILMIPFTDKRGMNDIVSNTYVIKNKKE